MSWEYVDTVVIRNKPAHRFKFPFKYDKRAPANELRCILSYDYVLDEDTLKDLGRLLHISVSVGREGTMSPTVKPSDYQLKMVHKEFCPTLSLKEEPPVDDPLVRHLWENPPNGEQTRP